MNKKKCSNVNIIYFELIMSLLGFLLLLLLLLTECHCLQSNSVFCCQRYLTQFSFSNINVIFHDNKLALSLKIWLEYVVGRKVGAM